MVIKDTAQESCLRLMGKKLLVSLAMEGKLHAEGLQAMRIRGCEEREIMRRGNAASAAIQVEPAFVKMAKLDCIEAVDLCQQARTN